MNKQNRVLILPVTFALFACGQNGGASHGKPDSAAAEALRTVQTQGPRTLGMQLPANLPRYAPVPQDSFITATAIGDRGSSSGSVEFSTTLIPSTALNFYKKAAEQGGLTLVTGDGQKEPVTWATPAGKTVLSVIIRPVAGVGSMVRLAYS